MRVDIYLPVNYDDGVKIAQSIMDEILLEITLSFGGYTLCEGQGGWLNDSKIIVEPVRVLTILTDNIVKVAQYVESIKTMLKQDTIFVVSYQTKEELYL